MKSRTSLVINLDCKPEEDSSSREVEMKFYGRDQAGVYDIDLDPETGRDYRLVLVRIRS